MHEDASNYLFNDGALEDFMKFMRGKAIEPLVPDWDNSHAVYSEVMVTLADQRDYYGEISKGPRQQPGHQLTVTIPFTGNAELWCARPAGIGVSGMSLQPRGVVDAEHGRLTLTFEGTEDPAAIPNRYERKQHEMQERIKLFLICQADALARHC